MLWLILIVGGLLIMMGQHDPPKLCSITSAWKIRFLRLISCGSLKSTSALPLCGRS
jgi:hypothetical protein